MVNSLLHAQADFTPGERVHCIHWVGDWVDPWTDLDVVTKKNP